MVDRPTLQEILQAVQEFLEKEVSPVVKADSVLYYRALIAVNLLRIAEREVDTGTKNLRAEWDRLNGIQGIDITAPSYARELRNGLARRNQLLAQSIRLGEYDDPTPRAVLLAHLVATAREQLEIANPRYLQSDSPIDEEI